MTTNTPQPFTITADTADKHQLRIAVASEVDIATAPQLLASLNMDNDGERVLLDLSAVTFIDSSGLHALIAMYEQLGDRLEIIPSPATTRLFAIAGIEDRLPLVR
jgi:anti-sigma B factor antagonist